MGEGNSKLQYEQDTKKKNTSTNKGQAPVEIQAKPTYSIDDYAECLRTFSGEEGDFVGSFIEQALYVRDEFNVPDKDLKLLIVKKLDGNAKRWFHSKPSHISATAVQLLEELRRTYGHTGNYQNLFDTFKERQWEWKQNEPFFNYYQAKIELGAGLNLGESQMVKFLIDGFDNELWSRQARAMNIHKTSLLLERMQQEIEKVKAAQAGVPQVMHPRPIAKQHKARSFTNLSQGAPLTLQPPMFNTNPATAQQIKPKQSTQIQCTICKKYGHVQNHCRYNKANQAKSNQVESLTSNLVDGLKDLTEKLELSNTSVPKAQGQTKPKVGGVRGELCQNCFRGGHTADVCQFPSLPKGVCHNCGSGEHMRPQCPYLQGQKGNTPGNNNQQSSGAVKKEPKVNKQVNQQPPKGAQKEKPIVNPPEPAPETGKKKNKPKIEGAEANNPPVSGKKKKKQANANSAEENPFAGLPQGMQEILNQTMQELAKEKSKQSKKEHLLFNVE